MKKSICLLTFICLSLLLLPNSSARSSEIFKEHLTNLMWEDCQGKDIHINQPILINKITNQSISLIPWPYSKDELRYLIEIIDGLSYRDYLGAFGGGSFVDSGWDGNSLLTCDDNRLNIDFDTYYWNGTKVDVPKEELFNIASGNNNTQVINKGDRNSVTTGNHNTVNTGDNNSITQQDLKISFAKGTFFGILISIMFKILYDIWGKKYLMRLLKRKKAQ